MGQGSREVKRDMGFAQVKPVLNEAEQMAQEPKPTPEPSPLCLKRHMLPFPKIKKSGLSPGGEMQKKIKSMQKKSF